MAQDPHTGRFLAVPVAERFWLRVKKAGVDECWIWEGQVFDHGYGQMWAFGRTSRAHRVAWILTNGKIPSGKFLLHSCDNRLCVNPAHLRLGNHIENMRDMVERNRQCRGERHLARQHPELRQGENNGRAKLTVEQVSEIRNRYAAGGVRQVDLAQEFGTDQTRISQIVRRKQWGHVL